MRKFEEVFSGRRWERKGSFNVYIFTFGRSVRSVEFARFVLMMTGAKTPLSSHPAAELKSEMKNPHTLTAYTD
jgi:hypothetical protein